MKKRLTFTFLLLMGAVLFVRPAAAQEIDLSSDVAAHFAAWLPDMGSADLAKMEAAQQNWQKTCFLAGAPGNDAMKSEVNALMTDRLDEAIDPVAKTWLLFQLGRTGSDAEVDAVAPLLTDGDFRVRRQALRTLAAIRSEKALTAIRTAAESAPSEIKAEMEETLKVVSYDFTIPIETEWPLCLPYVDDGAVEGWMANYGKLDVTAQARTLAALTVRGDKKYRPAVLAAIADGEPDLVRNGLLALEKLGTADDVPLLIEKARDADLRRVALTVASRIADPDFNSALSAVLEKTENADDFGHLTTILVNRGDVNALNAILDGAARWKENQVSLLNQAEQLAGKKDIPRFIDQMLTIENVGDRENVERIVMRLAGGDSTPVVAKLTDANRALILPCLGRIGDDQAFEILTGALADGNRPERDGAVKGFCNGPNALHADKLLAIANDAKMSGGNRIAALRAYVRVLSLPEDEIGIEISDADKLAALKNAFNIAPRDDERILVLERLKAVRTPETLAFVLPFVDHEKFGETAIATVMELAHHDFLRKENPEAFKAALDRVIEKSAKNDVVDQAKRYKDMIK